MSEYVKFITPTGRLVQGHPLEKQEKDRNGRPLTDKTGNPIVRYFLAIAIAKNDPGWAPLWAIIHSTARRDFPTLFDAAGNCSNPKFAFKVVDGDSTILNENNTKPCDCEGFPGHHILKFSTTWAPKVVKKVNGVYQEIVDPGPMHLKRGDFVRVAGSTVGNGDQHKPGVYVNPSMVEVLGYGDAIVSGPQPDAVFGDAPVGVLPAGCSPTPVASGAPPLPPAAATPAPVPPPPPAALAPATIPPGSQVTPATDVLQPVPPVAGATPPPPPPPAPPVPVAETRYIGPDGNVWPLSQLTTAGYSPAQIAALTPA